MDGTKESTIDVCEILEFYDLPQLFIGKTEGDDKVWVCLLVESTHIPKYLGIHISESKLEEYTSGSIDLRRLFSTESEYYLVTTPYRDGKYRAIPYKLDGIVKESFLPDHGFYHKRK